MDNFAIELHDSRLLTLVRTERSVTLRMRLYLHSSAGRPALDSGKGWSQDGDLVVEDGVIEGDVPAGDLWVLDGGLVVGGATCENCIPLPFERSGSSRLRLEGAGWNLSVAGSGMKVVG